MCDHGEGREHRTSPCYLCRAETAALPPMPLLWDGDDN